MRSFTRRIGLLGDVHCEDTVVEAALALFRAQSVEAVLCVGDVVDGQGDALRSIELLIGAGVEAVRGNHERWFASNTMRTLPHATAAGAVPEKLRAWLDEVPLTREYETPLGRMLLCHGMGGDAMESLRPGDFGYGLENNEPVQKLLREQKYRLVVSGHSHQRMVRSLGGITFLNAGTLARDAEPCVALIDFEASAARFFDWREGVLVATKALPLH